METQSEDQIKRIVDMSKSNEPKGVI